MTPPIQNDQLDDTNWSLCCGVPLLVLLLMGIGSWYLIGWSDRMMAEEEGLTVKEFQDKRERESKEPKTPRDRIIDSVILSVTIFGCYLVWHYIVVPVLVFLSKQ